MKFEYDPEKSASNRKKHGINFYTAQALLWQDSRMLEVPTKSTDEPRFLIIGKIAGKHWPAIVTYRHNTVRLISVRRSRKKEVVFYESQGS